MTDKDKTKEQLLEELKTLRDCQSNLKEMEDKLRKMEDGTLRSDKDWDDIFNTITDMITIHDSDFNIISANKAAEKILGLPILDVKKVKCYKYYHGTTCPPQGCPSCQCLKTGEPAAFEIFEPHLNMFVEIRAIPRFDRNNQLIGLIHIVRDISRRKRIEGELDRYRHHLEELVDERTSELKNANEELQAALDSVKTLKGLLPICAWCKKIRDDKGYWDKVEAYVEKHSKAKFTHGICPECAKKVYPEIFDNPEFEKEINPEPAEDKD